MRVSTPRVTRHLLVAKARSPSSHPRARRRPTGPQPWIHVKGGASACSIPASATDGWCPIDQVAAVSAAAAWCLLSAVARAVQEALLGLDSTSGAIVNGYHTTLLPRASLSGSTTARHVRRHPTGPPSFPRAQGVTFAEAAADERALVRPMPQDTELAPNRRARRWTPPSLCGVVLAELGAVRSGAC